MIELKHDALVFSFPDVHRDAVLRITFQRSLRVPPDNRDYHLPDPVRLPLRIDARDAAGTFVVPLRRSEALWLSFSAPWSFPFAVKVACAGVDALTGAAPRAGLGREPQDYVPVPAQTWLDGCCCGLQDVRQITADCMGIRDACGLGIAVHPARSSTYERSREAIGRGGASPVCYAVSIEAGVSPGARLHGDVVQDALTPDDWDIARAETCCIACVTDAEWLMRTGTAALSALRRSDYDRAGIPWLELYEDRAGDGGPPR